MLKHDEVIGVFSIASLKKDTKGKKFFNELVNGKKVNDISEGKWTSLVLTDSEAYITRISSNTLKARSNSDREELLGIRKEDIYATQSKRKLVKKPIAETGEAQKEKD